MREELDSPDYQKRHYRVKAARGPANANLCEGCCGGRARDWATIHGRSGEDPQDYVPLCRGCHIEYDDPSGAKRAAAARDNPACAYIPTPEQRQKLSASMKAYHARLRHETRTE